MEKWILYEVKNDYQYIYLVMELSMNDEIVRPFEANFIGLK